MEQFKRDLIEVYSEFAEAVLDGDIPDFDKITEILKKYGIAVNEELRIGSDE
jgi:hypothetical protein